MLPTLLNPSTQNITSCLHQRTPKPCTLLYFTGVFGTNNDTINCTRSTTACISNPPKYECNSVAAYCHQRAMLLSCVETTPRNFRVPRFLMLYHNDQLSAYYKVLPFFLPNLQNIFVALLTDSTKFVYAYIVAARCDDCCND